MHAPKAAGRKLLQKKAGDGFSRRRSDARKRDESCPANSDALPDTRSVNIESVPKRKEAKKFVKIRGKTLFFERSNLHRRIPGW